MKLCLQTRKRKNIWKAPAKTADNVLADKSGGFVDKIGFSLIYLKFRRYIHYSVDIWLIFVDKPYKK